MRTTLFLASLLLVSAAFAEDLPILLPQPDLAPDVQSVPRLAATDPASTQINDLLAETDSNFMGRDGIDCDLAPDPDSFLSRSISVDWLSPRFLGLQEEAGGNCAGQAHPWSYQDNTLYDLTTGREADWPTLLGPSLAVAYENGGYVSTPAVKDFYLKALEKDLSDDCKEASAEEGLGFRFWLSAKDHALAIEPYGFIYALTACIHTLYLSPDDLRTLGANPALIEELKNAR